MTRLVRNIFSAFAVLLALSFGVVPQGVHARNDGSLEMVLCVDGLAKTVWIDASGDLTDPPQQLTNCKDCRCHMSATSDHMGAPDCKIFTASWPALPAAADQSVAHTAEVRAMPRAPPACLAQMHKAGPRLMPPAAAPFAEDTL